MPGGLGVCAPLSGRSLDMHMERYYQGIMYHQGCRSVSPLSTDGLALQVTGDPLSRAEVGSVTMEPALPVGQEASLPSVPNTIRESNGLFSLLRALVIVSSQLPATVGGCVMSVWRTLLGIRGRAPGGLGVLGPGCQREKRAISVCVPRSEDRGETVGRSVWNTYRSLCSGGWSPGAAAGDKVEKGHRHWEGPPASAGRHPVGAPGMESRGEGPRLHRCRETEMGKWGPACEEKPLM